MRRQKNGTPITRTKKNPPPCRTAAGCPKGTPDNQLDLNARNRLAYRHYLACCRSGVWPADSLVARNLQEIAPLEHDAERHKRWLAEMKLEIALTRIEATIMRAAMLRSPMGS